LKIAAVIGTVAALSGALIYNFISTAKKTISQMLPPGQYEVNELPVLQVELTPTFNEKMWTLEVYGAIEKPFTLKYEQLLELKRVDTISDFHCVTGWSRLGNRWEGVRFKDIKELAKPLGIAKFVTFECDSEYTTSMPISDLLKDDVLLAYGLDGRQLPPEHGGPLRIVVPAKYGYKSAKWVRRIKFTEEQEFGYWEFRGYSNTADPFTDDRYGPYWERI
jgi:DMSO/TMAO reductase YedYZ molybdopterin-dependent catalytic subunit